MASFKVKAVRRRGIEQRNSMGIDPSPGACVIKIYIIFGKKADGVLLLAVSVSFGWDMGG